MTSVTGIGCTVYIDGERLADGAPLDNPTDPTALSGLSIVWGRATTVDQPDTSTATFDVMDAEGGTSFLTLLRTGRRVDIDATGTQWNPGADLETFTDGDFSGTPLGTLPGSVVMGAGTGSVIDPGGVPLTTLIATNLAPDPEGTALTRFSSTGGALNTLSLVTDYPDPNVKTAVRSTTTGAGNQRILDIRFPAYEASTEYRVRFEILLEGTFTNPLAVHLRPNISNTTGVTIYSAPLDPGLNVIEASGVTLANAPSNAAVVLTGNVSSGVKFTATKILIEKAPPSGVGFFSGNTRSTVTDKYAWTGAVNDSPSTYSTVTDGPSGNPAFRMVPNNAAVAVNAVFAPADYSTAPDAWDAIPTAQLGQVWQLSASVRAAAGSTITVEPVLFARPNGDRTPAGAFPAVTVTASGAWQIVPLSFQPTAANQWVGIRVRAFGFPRWVDIPGTWLDTPGTWLDYGSALVDDVSALAPTSAVTRTVRVFSGRITDLVAAYDEGADAPVVTVTAADFTADLENVTVGDEPWPVETMQARFERIVSLSGYPLETIIDPGVAGFRVSYQDVDAKGVTGLLQDLAQSVDGVFWAATHATTGPYIWVEDPAARPGLFTLEMGTDGLVHVVPGSGADAALTVSACDVLRDPVEWHQSVSDVSTRAAIGWLEQGTDDEGNPETTDRTATVIDAGLEGIYGVRKIQVSTLLQAAADAQAVANRILARTSLTDWRAAGFRLEDPASLDTDALDALIGDFLTMLDGTARNGISMLLVDLPEWSPGGDYAPVFLEGGTYSFIDGAWTLDLVVSSAAAQGASAAWVDMAAEWRWVDMAPEVSWSDLIGVQYP